MISEPHDYIREAQYAVEADDELVENYIPVTLPQNWIIPDGEDRKNIKNITFNEIYRVIIIVLIIIFSGKAFNTYLRTCRINESFLEQKEPFRITYPNRNDLTSLQKVQYAYQMIEILNIKIKKLNKNSSLAEKEALIYDINKILNLIENLKQERR